MSGLRIIGIGILNFPENGYLKWHNMAKDIFLFSVSFIFSFFLSYKIMMMILLVVDEYIITGLVILSYLIFYTSYSKEMKRIDIRLLLDFLFCRRGCVWSLVELNKVLALSGLTILLLSYLPFLNAKSRELLWISMNILWCHSLYSLVNGINICTNTHIFCI